MVKRPVTSVKVNYIGADKRTQEQKAYYQAACNLVLKWAIESVTENTNQPA